MDICFLYLISVLKCFISLIQWYLLILLEIFLLLLLLGDKIFENPGNVDWVVV